MFAGRLTKLFPFALASTLLGGCATVATVSQQVSERLSPGSRPSAPAAAPASEQLKVWERNDDGLVLQDGAAVARVARSIVPGGGPHGFMVQGGSRGADLRSFFQGSCSQEMDLLVEAQDTRKLDLAPFLTSRAGKDLPASVHQLARLMQRALAGQCDALEVVRLRFRPVYAHQGDFVYEGTLMKRAAWALQDGRVATAFDQARPFQIRYRDMMSVAGVHHVGLCEANPALLIEPMFSNETERRLSPPPSIGNFEMVARDVAPVYAQRCPQATTIRFAISPMPRDLQCVQPGDCFLLARRERDQWVVDRSQMRAYQQRGPVQDANDMLEVLAAGRFDIVADYRQFFSYVLVRVLASHGRICTRYLQHPVKRTTQLVQVTRDRFGAVTREVREQPVEVILERAHLEVFERHAGPAGAWATALALQATLGGAGGRSTADTMDAAMAAAGHLYMLQTQVEAFVGADCLGDRQRTVQDNLLRFSRGQAALTGRYDTRKQRLVRAGEAGSSAPVFAGAYRQERAHVLQSRPTVVQ